MLVWNSSPKECSHKLTHFCFFKHQLDSPQGLGAVPFPNHFGTVKHKSWGVEALEAESYDLGTRCKLLRVSARFLFFFFFSSSSSFFPLYHKDFFFNIIIILFQFYALLLSLSSPFFFSIVIYLLL